jgi:GNAT superfamily N-acetyltransferase
MSNSNLSEVEKLWEGHQLDSFDCGNKALNDWLKGFALLNQRGDAVQTYVVHRGQVVVGYYSLAAGSVRREEATARVAKGLAQHPIGVILLARLAVDQREKGRGLGKALLKDSLLRIHGAADIVGARAVLVHAIDTEAAEFYKHFNFEPSSVDPLTLMLLMKDLRASL